MSRLIVSPKVAKWRGANEKRWRHRRIAYRVASHESETSGMKNQAK
jgi:hypothetical protein